MFIEFEKYKGVHPGAVLERVLKKRHLGKRPFALSLPEHPQTLNAITKGKRDLNVALSLKIEHALGLEEGSLMTLQVFYDIKKEKNNLIPKPDLNKIRQILFWDTDIQKIDWTRQYKFVIKRVFERETTPRRKSYLNFMAQKRLKRSQAVL